MKPKNLIKHKVFGVVGGVIMAGMALLPTLQVFAQTATTTDNTMGTTTSSTSTTTAPIATSTPITIMIMKHVCNSSVTNLNDFNNLGGFGSTTNMMGSTTLDKFLAAEIACPTSELNGTNNYGPSGAATGPRTNFDFSLTMTNGGNFSNGSSTQSLKNNSTFVPSKVCENQVNRDWNSNGFISSQTCLDASSYKIVATTTDQNNQNITVTETNSGNGYFAGVLFTPQEIMANNDASGFLGSTTSGVMNFNLASDTDHMIMLHVFNIMNPSTTTPGSGTTTPPTNHPGDNDHDVNHLFDLIRNLQDQLNALKIQVQNLITQIANLNTGNGNGNNGGNGGNTGGLGIAHVRAAATSAVAGDTDDFAGDHFGSSEQVVMTSGSDHIMTVTTDKEGNFGTGSIHLPYLVGDKVYTFTGQTSGDVVNVTIHVLPIP